jgi:hypothetical protein
MFDDIDPEFDDIDPELWDLVNQAEEEAEREAARQDERVWESER